MHERIRMVFAGGGTVGPVTPLLAVLDACAKQFVGVEAHWVGTHTGPERELIAKRGLPFTALRAAKIDRFVSLRNVVAPFVFVASCVQAWRVLRSVKPQVVVAAGAFVAVPVVIMARLMRIPTLIHQLDVRPGLANKLMAPFADAITVTFERSLADFPAHKTSWTGAPVREEILHPKTNSLPLKAGKPVILVFGGGTGAQAINELVASSVEELTAAAQVVHITGKGRDGVSAGGQNVAREDYHRYEFLVAEMGEALHKADLVVTRAGLGTMLELAALHKAAVVIPMPASHQEDNAHLLTDAVAAVVLDQNRISPQEFASIIKKLLASPESRQDLGKQIATLYRGDAAKLIVEKIALLVYPSQSND